MWKTVESESCLGEHSKTNTDTEKYSVQRVGNYHKLRNTYKDMSRVLTVDGRHNMWGSGGCIQKSIASKLGCVLCGLRVCIVWEILYDKVLPVRAWQGRTCGQCK